MGLNTGLADATPTPDAPAASDDSSWFDLSWQEWGIIGAVLIGLLLVLLLTKSVEDVI